MLKRLFLIITLITILVAPSFSQYTGMEKSIDSLLKVNTTKPFNGIIIVAQNGKKIYKTKKGYSDIENKKKLDWDNQFVVGSISKQFTAVLVLLEYEKGKIDLNAPISTYLPDLKQKWADTVTTDHLLKHMHGISEIDKPLTFEPDSRYEYSQIGYELLAQIVEKVTGKSFVELSSDLFVKYGMKYTCHPLANKHNKMGKGYCENESGQIMPDTNTTKYVAAGGFVSTSNDLIIWNKQLNEGHILKKETYDLMIDKKKGAIRNHPVFGHTEYGYGITVECKDGLLQLGQTGYAPGFVSMDFYFPQTKTSVIVLENITYDIYNLKNTFYYHSNILDIVKAHL